MTALFLKSARVQTVLLNGLETPPPPVFYSEELTIEVLTDDGIFAEIEILDELEVVLCPEV